MKKIIIALILLFITSTVYADKLIVPFSVYPKDFAKLCYDYGRTIDLSGNDRTEESWGFIQSEGSSFIIYTYYPATKDDMKWLLRIINKYYGEIYGK
jgi:hypothetical protein